MREQLLSSVGDAPTSSSGRQQLLRLRGGDDDSLSVLVSKCSGCFLILFLLFKFFVAAVSPLQYGLLRSSTSGQVNDLPVQGGLHPVMPWQNYLLFPATRVTLEWSNSYYADRQRVNTRTGADPNDPDSGGQPIGISCAVQFQFRPEKLKQVFLNFGSYQAGKARYTLLAGNVVSNTAQDFIPQDFWQQRHVIAAKMLHLINETLFVQGAEAKSFEIMKVDFQPTFENSITGVQVAVQQRVVNEYSQQVQTVEQQINVLNSENQARIATIKAHADRTAKEKIGNATKQAFILKQKSKANQYKKLQEALELTSAQFAEYIKIRSFIMQSGAGKVVVEIPPPMVTGVTADGQTRKLL